MDINRSYEGYEETTFLDDSMCYTTNQLSPKLHKSHMKIDPYNGLNTIF